MDIRKTSIKPEISLDFNDAKPTNTHMAIKSFISKGLFIEFYFIFVLSF